MQFWQHRTPLTWLLSPLSLIFWFVSKLRCWLFRQNILKSYRSPIPVLVVGNLSVGGNGKTPVVIWLVEQLQQRGVRVGVVSRGYGGRNKQFPILVTADSEAEQVGDEPVLIARRTHCPVAVSPNRRQSIELLLSQFELDLIITDDGLQHYALQRDLEWVVVDGERRFGNGFVLPAGNLRELPSRLKAVQAVICNGGTAQAGEYQMRLISQIAVNLKTGEKRPLVHFRHQFCAAMAGIGYPPRFFKMLQHLNIPLKREFPFADHQTYTASELIKLADPQTPLLMTEKDAVKCHTFAEPHWWFIPVSAQFEPSESEKLLTPILTLIERKQNERSTC